MSDWDVEKQPVLIEPIDLTNSENITVADLIGKNDEENFLSFDLTEVQNLVSNLQSVGVDDLAHAMLLQQQALRCADILSEYIGKIVKTISFLESSLSSKKNKASLNYTLPTGTKPSIELRKMAGEADPDVAELQVKIAKAKGAKSVLDKKYDIVIKAHHHYKEIAMGLRRVI